MKFQPTVDLDALTRKMSFQAHYGERMTSLPLQRGQWVTAGKNGTKGRFVKVSPAGVVYVAWDSEAWQRFKAVGAFEKRGV